MRIATKMTIGIILISLTGLFLFSQFARNTGKQMMETHASEESRVYAQVIANYLKHTMLEHAGDGSLKHFSSVFEDVFAGGENYFFDSNLFLINDSGEVRINLTDDPSFQRISDEQLQVIKNSDLDERMIELPEFSSAYTIFKIDNEERCQDCHGTESSVRGYIGVSTPINTLLSLASGHSKKNYAWMILIVIVVAGGIMILTYVLVITPVHRLEKELTAISNELEIRDDAWERFGMIRVKHTGDEVNILGDRINFLLENLNRSRRALKHSHDERIETANRLVSAAEMAASLAHEIKNPLAGVMGALEVIYQKTPQDDEFKGTIAEINRQLFRINHTLDDLLVFARPSKPSFSSLDVNEVIRSTLAMLRANPSTGSIDFEFDSPEERHYINGDTKQINQVFWNVLNNATQAMRKGGTLKVSVTSTQDHVQIIVEDDGEGIRKED